MNGECENYKILKFAAEELICFKQSLPKERKKCTSKHTNKKSENGTRKNLKTNKMKKIMLVSNDFLMQLLFIVYTCLL